MARCEYQQVSFGKPQRSCPAPTAPWLAVQGTTGAGEGPVSTPFSLPTVALHSTQLALSNCFCQELDRTGNFDHTISKGHRCLARVLELRVMESTYL